MKNIRGVSLVELLVVVTILSIFTSSLGGVIYSMVLQGNSVRAQLEESEFKAELYNASLIDEKCKYNVVDVKTENKIKLITNEDGLAVGDTYGTHLKIIKFEVKDHSSDPDDHITETDHKALYVYFKREKSAFSSDDCSATNLNKCANVRIDIRYIAGTITPPTEPQCEPYSSEALSGIGKPCAQVNDKYGETLLEAKHGDPPQSLANCQTGYSGMRTYVCRDGKWKEEFDDCHKSCANLITPDHCELSAANHGVIQDGACAAGYSSADTPECKYKCYKGTWTKDNSLCADCRNTCS